MIATAHCNAKSGRQNTRDCRNSVLRHLGIFAVLMGLATSFPLSAPAATPATEAELKAVLLFHLTQFVTWPATPTNQSEFVIGIVGPDPFGPALDAVVKNENVDGRPIRVVRENRARDLPRCSLVYISPQARGPTARIFNELSNSGALTIGESPDFLDDGGMVRFRRTPDRKIRLQIHLTRARQNGFNISAQLLRVSDVVEGGAQ